MPFREFGRYEVLAKLATGGAASIFLAREPGLAGFHKLVCLKTLLPERARDPDFIAMFLDEARLVALLNHPNCVQVYDLGQVDGVYYISMEFIFGDTLWGLLSTVSKSRVPLPHAQVAALIADVCDGLHHAHELANPKGGAFNLVHRDISPQNVMISYEGLTKILDFGIAKAETGRAETVSGIVKGKFSYMSPEQITGAPVDRRSDIFSLGIVLFECLASRRLYRAETPEDIARLILEHRAPRLRTLLPGVPAALDEVAAIALAREPANRFQTAKEMGDALRSYLDSVRYVESASALARLLDDRLGDRIRERRPVYEAALNGVAREADIIRAFGASPVRELDFFAPGPEQRWGGLGGSGTEDVEEWSMEALLVADVEAHARTAEISPADLYDGSPRPLGEVDADQAHTQLDPKLVAFSGPAAPLSSGSTSPLMSGPWVEPLLAVSPSPPSVVPWTTGNASSMRSGMATALLESEPSASARTTERVPQEAPRRPAPQRPFLTEAPVRDEDVEPVFSLAQAGAASRSFEVKTREDSAAPRTFAGIRISIPRSMPVPLVTFLFGIVVGVVLGWFAALWSLGS